ncbi:MAG: ATP-binding cassette domain-containing protein [Rhodopila sp.]|nr:ATP-binding cassette domain-containing protein [Rhodopila sp.]
MSSRIGRRHPETIVPLEDMPDLHAPASVPDGPVVRLGNVGKKFGTVTALHDVTFEVQRGEILGIIGRSGAGKSTLIRCLNGLEKPDRGRVEILGQDIVPLTESALQQVRGRIGMIFQHFNLLSTKTVEQNVALPLKIAGTPRPERTARVRELLELVGLSDKAQVYPAKLSGGQKQRVGIARALAAHPALLLCDEATSALDPETTLSILNLLRDINRRLGLTIVLITHEMSVVRAIADRVIVMDQGRIVEEGDVWQVFAAPEAALTQRLIGSQTSELPSALRDGLRNDWTQGAHLVLRVQLSGDAAQRPVLAEMTRDLDVLPVMLNATVQHVQEQAVASFVVAFADAGEALARRVGDYLAARVSRLEVLGYVQQLA